MTTKPDTAYTYRRALALVQVLAMGKDNPTYALERLCASWGVEPVRIGSSLLVYLTLCRLAEHALAAAREERDHV